MGSRKTATSISRVEKWSNNIQEYKQKSTKYQTILGSKTYSSWQRQLGPSILFLMTSTWAHCGTSNPNRFRALYLPISTKLGVVTIENPTCTGAHMCAHTGMHKLTHKRARAQERASMGSDSFSCGRNVLPVVRRRKEIVGLRSDEVWNSDATNETNLMKGGRANSYFRVISRFSFVPMQWCVKQRISDISKTKLIQQQSL